MARTKITKKDIDHIAELIMVRLTDNEKKVFTPQLADILNYVAKLEKLNTSKTKETYHVTGLENVLREDEVTDSLPQKDSLSNAAQTEDSYFKVPGKLYL